MTKNRNWARTILEDDSSIFFGGKKYNQHLLIKKKKEKKNHTLVEDILHQITSSYKFGDSKRTPE